MKITDKNRYLYILLTSFSLFFWGFILFFFKTRNFLPLNYEIDTYTFLNISESFSNFDFNNPFTIGMSPVYPFFLSFIVFFINSVFSFHIFNYLCSLLMIFFIYNLFSDIFCFKKSFFITFLIWINPYIFELCLSGYSEIFTFTMLSGAFFFLHKNNIFLYAIFSSIGVNIRPELFISVIIISFLLTKKKKKTFLSFAFLFFLISIFFSYLSVDHDQPFFNKLKLFSYVFEYYSEIADHSKDDFLQKMYFKTGDAYSIKDMKNTLEGFSKEFSLKEYVKKYPKNYIKNFIRIIKIIGMNFYILLVFIPFIKINLINKRIFLIISILAPIFIVSAIPIESYEYRYFIYLMFPLGILCGLNNNLFHKKKIIIIFTAIFSLIHSFLLFDEYLPLFRTVEYIKKNNIKNSVFCSSNRWIEYYTFNKTVYTPPYSKDMEKYSDYLIKNNVDYYIIHPDILFSDSSFYNENLLINLKNRQILKNKVLDYPIIFKVNKR